MNVEQEFSTVDLLLKSSFETRGVDSFALSIIKLERQVRRIFSFLIYQHPDYSAEDIKMLRTIISKNKRMYFENFIKGIEHIYCSDLSNLYGVDFQNDFDRLIIIQGERNKIFHGQTTTQNLSRHDLTERIKFMKKWSLRIQTIFESEVGFNGFNRNSFQKSSKNINLLNIDSFRNYEEFKNLLKGIGR
ncbi:hypothetical protein [Winogradskyella sp.]|uniref:hypothetical protein n=1 Tax=Winogradskyella sp. TaxID=1883156 RepID=UPI0025E34936|nr:hypothetical protein [Winogradskyella sp.]